VENKNQVKIIEPSDVIEKIADESVFNIKTLLPERMVEHVGAMAIPMAGREEIDIMVISPNIQEDSVILNDAGYDVGPIQNEISYFKKFVDGIEIGIQIASENHPMIDIHRNIIKKLKNNPDLKKKYSKFKHNLNGLTLNEYKLKKNIWIKENLL
jgi:GrpB-like predicted nucleotidyltransferase (UPF0157 family)